MFGLFGLGFVVFCFLFASVMEFLNPPRVLDLDDRQPSAKVLSSCC